MRFYEYYLLKITVMNFEFYSLPLELNGIPQKKELARCSLKQSVADNLHLILTSTFNSLSSDSNFGSSIWDADFDNISNPNKQKEAIIHSVQQVIRQYEKRMVNTRVEIKLNQEESSAGNGQLRVKKKMQIVITGNIALTNETIVYRDHFFVSPLSYDL